MKFVLLISFSLLVSCADPRTLESTPDTIHAIWNPTTGEIPTPSDLVRDADANRLDLPIDDPLLSAAEVEFRTYLNSLDGYPLQTTLTLPVSGSLRETTIRSSLLMIDMTDSSSVPLTTSFDTERNLIRAKGIPSTLEDAAFRPGRTYAFGLAGYGPGVQGSAGEVVIADAAFYLVRSRENLISHPYAMPGESRAEREEIAHTLEELRVELSPLYRAMEQRGIPRYDIAVASSFTTTNRPSIWFDSEVGEVPVPNGVLIDPSTGLVNLPIGEDEPASDLELKEAINHYDGFSTSAAITIKATHYVDPQTVNAETVRVFRLKESGEILEETDVERGVLQNGQTFYVKPRLSFEPGTWHVFVATRQIVADGRSLEPQPLGALLRSKTPLLVDGIPQVGILDQDSAELLEPLRAKMEPVLDKLENEGLERSSISVAVPFRTLTGLEEMMDLRASLYTRNVSTDLRNVVNASPIARGLPLILRDVETIVTGELSILDYIDPATRRFRPDMTPEERFVSFVLTLPENARPGEPIPTVIFGHGLFTSRELAYLIANKLAQSGFAVFSLDLPYHGERSVCLTDIDCTNGATCDPLGQCILPSGAKGELATVASPWPNGPRYPATSGSAFIEIDNIVGSRDHFTQGVLDLAQGLRVIREADWSAASGGYQLDGDDVVYLGMSLGGILGSMFAAVEPSVNDFVLNVPGGNLFQLLTTSDSFQTAFGEVLSHRNIERGTDEYFKLEVGLRWLLDPVDPINIAHHATVTPFDYIDPIDGELRTSPLKRVLIQMAEGDLVVPNNATISLSERMQVPIQRYDPTVSNHAFLFDPTSFNGAEARQDMVDFFEARP